MASELKYMYTTDREMNKRYQYFGVKRYVFSLKLFLWSMDFIFIKIFFFAKQK